MKDGEEVEPKTVLAEWDPYNDYLISEKAGLADFKEFELNASYQEEKDQITGRFRKRVIDPTDDKLHPHINVKGDNHKVLQRYNIPTGRLRGGGGRPGHPARRRAGQDPQAAGQDQ